MLNAWSVPQIQVDGSEFHHFKHRVPVERVRAMHIAGDVSIQTINVIGVREKHTHEL